MKYKNNPMDLLDSYSFFPINNFQVWINAAIQRHSDHIRSSSFSPLVVG